MLEYDRINISESLDINKTRASKKCGICHYWHFLNNGCHNSLQKAASFDNVAIVSIKGNGYRIHFWYMTKNDAINILNNSNLDKKLGYYNFFFHYI